MAAAPAAVAAAGAAGKGICIAMRRRRRRAVRCRLCTDDAASATPPPPSPSSPEALRRLHVPLHLTLLAAQRVPALESARRSLNVTLASPPLYPVVPPRPSGPSPPGYKAAEIDQAWSRVLRCYWIPVTMTLSGIPRHGPEVPKFVFKSACFAWSG